MIDTHRIKLPTQYFEAIQSRNTNVIVVRNDRKYKEGDWLVLLEWTGKKYTDFYIVRWVEKVHELDAMGLDSYVLICMK